MARGDKTKYTEQQKHQAERIEQRYVERGALGSRHGIGAAIAGHPLSDSRMGYA